MKMEEVSLCRTCLSQTSLSPIFADTQDHTQSNAIFIATGRKIEPNDGLPQKMCTSCVAFLNNCLEFRKKCEEAEISLLNFKKQIELNQFVKIENFQIAETKTNLGGDDKSLRHLIDTNYIASQNSEVNKDFNIEVLTNENEANDIEYDCVEHNNDIVKSEVDNIIQSVTETEVSKINNSGENISVPLYEMVNANKRRVLCKICQKELSIRSIDSHLAKNHPGADETRVKCELCDSYVTKAKMNRHVVLMHGSGTYKCGYCKSEHDSREVLIAHVVSCAAKKKKRKPSETGRELHECDVCHKTMQRASLRMHKLVKHAGLGPVCEHCGVRFSNKLRLEEHWRAKHGRDKFACEHCDFRSASRAAMRNHERRHRGEKPFVCESCGAKFHAAYLLAQHRHSHRTEKLVKCEQCPATFKASNSLHKHKLSCHGSSSYRCEVCDRSYRCRHYAVKHLRQVHRFKGTTPPIRKETAAV